MVRASSWRKYCYTNISNTNFANEINADYGSFFHWKAWNFAYLHVHVACKLLMFKTAPYSHFLGILSHILVMVYMNIYSQFYGKSWCMHIQCVPPPLKGPEDKANPL